MNEYASPDPRFIEVTAPYVDGPLPASSPVANKIDAGVGRIRIHHLQQAKDGGKRFTMLTAYEQYTAEIFDEAGIEVLPVGDSASNNVLGNQTSLPVTADESIPMCAAL